MDRQTRRDPNEPYANPHHHHLLAPPLSNHMPSDHHLKRPLPVNGHSGHLKMPESPLGSSSSIPPSPLASVDPQQAASAHMIDEYLQTQISRWRNNKLEMTELISELLTVMPSEDQMQFMKGIMEVINQKRNNPEEEKQMRKYFLGGATGC